MALIRIAASTVAAVRTTTKRLPIVYCSTGKNAVIGGSASTSYSRVSATTPTIVRHGPSSP